MIKSFLILVLLEVAFAYHELCIPQGNQCKEDWQCCKGFHCEKPIYKKEPHCIADHEQLTHEETEPEPETPPPPVAVSGEVPASTDDSGSYAISYAYPPSPPPSKPKQRPEQILMMKLMEAALGQLTQGKPIRMKVNIKNPQVLLSKLPKGPDSYERLKKFKSPWGEHTHKEGEAPRILPWGGQEPEVETAPPIEPEEAMIVSGEAAEASTVDAPAGDIPPAKAVVGDIPSADAKIGMMDEEKVPKDFAPKGTGAEFHLRFG